MDTFEKSVQSTGSLLCVGIDPPLIVQTGKRLRRLIGGDLRSTGRHIKKVIKAAKPHAAAFKPNLAFFIARGSKGIDLLMHCRDWCGETPLILDGKFNDIGNTLEGYALFAASLGADAVTASPYMGNDFQAFINRGIAVFVLGTTTNAPDIQKLEITADAGTLARHVALQISDRPDELGLVVGHDAGTMRELCPTTWFLSPGLGAQGIAASEILKGVRRNGSGLLVNASRSIWTANDPGLQARQLADTLAPKSSHPLI
jgi:orotidine-5'-phosphate decarboxylase